MKNSKEKQSEILHIRFRFPLQNGEECYCGTDYGKYGKAENCRKRCRSGEICGGSYANSVYKAGKFHV